MMRKVYKDWTNIPQIIPVQVMSDIHSYLGKEYVPYNNFMPEATKVLTRVNTK